MEYIFLVVTLYTIFLPRFFSDSVLTNLDVFEEDKPLILTPYLEKNKIDEARNLARVNFPGFPNLESYAGFFTVDKTYNSNQFFWYFPAKSYIEEQAVILWLQGGPGASSLFGLFCENGPLEVINGNFKERNINWSKHYHLLYIDNPVGAGFSFTNDTRGYCTNQSQIGDHLYSTLTQFFQLFPELQNFPFFISGESYGGKYVPIISYTIHKKNPSAKTKINLKGLMIGNGWSDPINQLDYGIYLYQIGLIDWNVQKIIEDTQINITELIKTERWLDAGNGMLELYNFIYSCTGNISLINYLSLEPGDDDEAFFEFEHLIQNDLVRKSIHVGSSQYQNLTTVFDIMRSDLMKSVAPWISELLEHYHILFYNGQLDINVAYPLTVNFLKKLNFSAREEYLKVDRKILYNIGENNSSNVVGFLKSAGKLTEVLVRNATHLAPRDQPEWIYNLINWWRLHLNHEVTTDHKIILNANELSAHSDN